MVFLIKRIKETKGEISILIALFILILCIMLSGLTDIGNRHWGLRETQTKIDIAGTNALYQSIDLNGLRDETLQIIGGGTGITSSGEGTVEGGNSGISSNEVESIIKRAYEKELSEIKYGKVYPTVKYSTVKFEYTNKGLGYKTDISRDRPQVSLESVVSYTVDSSPVLDSYTGNKNKDFSSSFSNSQFTVSINESANDGKVELLIHSITRIVLK